MRRSAGEVPLVFGQISASESKLTGFVCEYAMGFIALMHVDNAVVVSDSKPTKYVVVVSQTHDHDKFKTQLTFACVVHADLIVFAMLCTRKCFLTQRSQTLSISN